MAGSTLNKQPIFTATPILISQRATLQTPNQLGDADNVTVIYTDISTNGTLITKITVSTDGIIGVSIPNTTIYLYVFDSTNGTYNLYKSAIISEVASVGHQIVPYVEFVFDGGLVLSTGSKLALGTTNNNERYSVVVEGGTYDQPV